MVTQPRAEQAPMNLDALIASLDELRTSHPDCGDRPVQMMVVAGEGLVTGVEVESLETGEVPIVVLWSNEARAGVES
jgi:hypothetical protein